MRLVVIVLLATVTACSTPPRPSESQANTGDRTTAPPANSPTAAPPPPSAPIVAPTADPRTDRRTHVSVGERRVVGLEIFYTRGADGKAVEVDCYPMRGG